MYILIDCNNFFASCEIVANPTLKGKPLVVISGADGVILARSKEAKALGVPMGAPVFEWVEHFRKYNIIQASSNFELYRKISRQVMSTIKGFGYDVEVYSVDEAFLHVAHASENEARWMKEEILKATGIEVSIGIAPTKTLAKAANFFSKKDPLLKGVKVISEATREDDLKNLPVDEVWGIGKKGATKLAKTSVYTAWDFTELPDTKVRKALSVIGLKICMELRGTDCHGFHEGQEAKKSISMARSFKKREQLLSNIETILAGYVVCVAEELREEKQLAGAITISIETNPFGKEEYYSNSESHYFIEPTNYTPDLVHVAKELLGKIFQEGHSYKKVGVTLSQLSPEGSYQPDFFSDKPKEEVSEKKKLMNIMEKLNQKFGAKSLCFGTEIENQKK